MDAAWAVVIGSAITGVVGVISGAIAPFAMEVWRTRSKRDAAFAADRAKAFSDLLKTYAASQDLRSTMELETWIRVTATAATCIPFTSKDGRARELCIELANKHEVDFGELVEAITAESS